MLSENEDKEIERFSDRKRKTHNKREALASYLKLTPSNFPAELVQGTVWNILLYSEIYCQLYVSSIVTMIFCSF